MGPSCVSQNNSHLSGPVCSCSCLALFENEYELQKTEPALIPLINASRTFPDVKTRNEIIFYNWTSEIIPFICLGEQMDRT